MKRGFVLDFKLSMLEFVSSFSIVDFILDFRSSMSEFIFLIDGMSDFLLLLDRLFLEDLLFLLEFLFLDFWSSFLLLDDMSECFLLIDRIFWEFLLFLLEDVFLDFRSSMSDFLLIFDGMLKSILLFDSVVVVSWSMLFFPSRDMRFLLEILLILLFN